MGRGSNVQGRCLNSKPFSLSRARGFSRQHPWWHQCSPYLPADASHFSGGTCGITAGCVFGRGSECRATQASCPSGGTGSQETCCQQHQRAECQGGIGAPLCAYLSLLEPQQASTDNDFVRGWHEDLRVEFTFSPVSSDQCSNKVLKMVQVMTMLIKDSLLCAEQQGMNLVS